MKNRLSIFRAFLFFLVSFLFYTCKPASAEYKSEAANPAFLHRSLSQLTDVIVYDIFSPPVASRIYAYASIAGYEALLPDFPECRTLAGQLNGLEATPSPEAGKEYSFPLASARALLQTGKALIFSEDKMEAFENEILKEFKNIGVPDDVFERSVAYGDAVSKHILAWANKDNYKQTRTAPKYTIQDDPGTWKPTPPAYMDGIEPHWKDIRALVMDSSMQFAPPPPTAFDPDKKSRFFEETMEVYAALKVEDSLRSERLAIASFWDCNPYVSHQVGHVMFATKKITPGGHWMGIARLAAQSAGKNIMESAEAYVLTSIALMDGFISCWDEKYRSNLIRPETVINAYIDESWLPALQTPPFPEYTSGHSVISRAAATALTSLYGDNFSFVDSVEVRFGLPQRSFPSFYKASEEAAISRLYGGIHYRPAIENGVKQGQKVGDYVVENVKLRKG